MFTLRAQQSAARCRQNFVFVLFKPKLPKKKCQNLRKIKIFFREIDVVFDFTSLFPSMTKRVRDNLLSLIKVNRFDCRSSL